MKTPMMRVRTERTPVEHYPLTAGDKVKFAGETHWYTVRAVSADGRWVICTKPFNLRRTVIYTIIDFDSGVRGPDNLIFSGGYETDEQVAEAMTMLEAGRMSVSVRRDLALDIERVRRAGAA